MLAGLYFIGLNEFHQATPKPSDTQACLLPDLIRFWNLTWEEQCLHVEKNQAPVSTASKMQVREPINTSSIGRWKRYDKFTKELQILLASL